MSASDHINPHQLRMFMLPHELMQLPSSDANDYGGDTATMWRRKLKESQIPSPRGIGLRGHGTGVHAVIAAEGVRDPLWIDHTENPGGTLFDGHHRVASAAVVRPDQYIPVEHTDDVNWQTTSRRR